MSVITKAAQLLATQLVEQQALSLIPRGYVRIDGQLEIEYHIDHFDGDITFTVSLDGEDTGLELTLSLDDQGDYEIRVNTFNYSEISGKGLAVYGVGAAASLAASLGKRAYITPNQGSPALDLEKSSTLQQYYDIVPGPEKHFHDMRMKWDQEVNYLVPKP